MKLAEALQKGYRFKRPDWDKFRNVSELGIENAETWELQDWIVEEVNFHNLPSLINEDVNIIQETSSVATAIKYDIDKPKMSLISYESAAGEARALEFGANKYSKGNYKNGMDWSRLLDAAERHLKKFGNKIDFDEDSKLNHLYHAKASIGMLIYYYENKIGKDDR